MFRIRFVKWGAREGVKIEFHNCRELKDRNSWRDFQTERQERQKLSFGAMNIQGPGYYFECNEQLQELMDHEKLVHDMA